MTTPLSPVLAHLFAVPQVGVAVAAVLGLVWADLRPCDTTDSGAAQPNEDHETASEVDR